MFQQGLPVSFNDFLGSWIPGSPLKSCPAMSRWSHLSVVPFADGATPVFHEDMQPPLCNTISRWSHIYVLP